MSLSREQEVAMFTKLGTENEVRGKPRNKTEVDIDSIDELFNTVKKTKKKPVVTKKKPVTKESENVNKMEEVYFPNALYSENKLAIKKVIKELGLKWSFPDSGWFSSDKINYIIAEFEGSGLPATFHINIPNKAERDKVVKHMVKYGGELSKSEKKTLKELTIEKLEAEKKVKIENFKRDAKSKFDKKFVEAWSKKISIEYDDKIVNIDDYLKELYGDDINE